MNQLKRPLLICLPHLFDYFTINSSITTWSSFVPKSTSKSRRSTSKKTATNSAKSKQKHFSKRFFSSKQFVLGIFAVLAAFTMGAHALGARIYKDSQDKVTINKVTDITGSIHFTALKPEPSDKGKLKLLTRRLGSEMWMNTNVAIDLTQDAPFVWSEALPGVTYEVAAELTIDGKVYKNSRTAIATAPSYDLEIPIEITWSDLPEEVVSLSTAKISGLVTINGHIPEGSVLEVYTLEAPDPADVITELNPTALLYATKVVSIEDPQAATTWTWEEAEPLKEYEVVVALRSGNEVIIAPQLVIADAGEEALEHQINSPFQPSVLGVTSTSASSNGAGTSGLSGLVTLEGPKAKDTSLLMLWRKPGDANYNVVNRYQYPAHSGTKWSWSGAEVGQTYEIMAALQVDNNNTSTAPNPARVTAPASNVNFDLNTYFVLPATTGTPVLETCINRTGDNKWTAIIDIPTMANAGNYWVQVGSANNMMGNVYDQKFSAGDNNQGFKVQVGNIPNGIQQLVRYSYSNCANCQDNNDFAPYSTTVGFTCE